MIPGELWSVKGTIVRPSLWQGDGFNTPAPVTGCRQRRSGGACNPCIEQLPFAQEQYLGEGDSCELSAANTPHS